MGSDSNVRISLSEELRLLEYSQRLQDRGRAVLAAADKSTGRVLYEAAANQPVNQRFVTIAIYLFKHVEDARAAQLQRGRRQHVAS